MASSGSQPQAHAHLPLSDFVEGTVPDYVNILIESACEGMVSGNETDGDKVHRISASCGITNGVRSTEISYYFQLQPLEP